MKMPLLTSRQGDETVLRFQEDLKSVDFFSRLYEPLQEALRAFHYRLHIPATRV
ncbi:hypothetical protein ES703_125684 [subsurface metagenome]